MADILHFTPREKWENSQTEGEYRGDTLATEGFIHCCLFRQLAGVVPDTSMVGPAWSSCGSIRSGRNRPSSGRTLQARTRRSRTSTGR